MAAKNQDRLRRERARAYEARTAWNHRRVQRRRRDTVIASVVGGLLMVLLLGAQILVDHRADAAPSPATPTATATPTSGS